MHTWKLGFLESNDPTPRRMLGWNIVSWEERELSSHQVRKWVKENLTKGTYRISYSYPECLIERDSDVCLMLLRWS